MLHRSSAQNNFGERNGLLLLSKSIYTHQYYPTRYANKCLQTGFFFARQLFYFYQLSKSFIE